MVGNEQSTLYSCKCINVQLKSSPPPKSGAQSDLPQVSEWTTVFVSQDEDIKIIYPHLTLRSRHRAPYIPDPTRCARYTTLTCLSCQTLVYRIHQTVLLDDELNIREGPIITKGWAETEVLRSSSGWLEVSTKDVLVGNTAINQQKTLPQFSELFGIVLPTTSTSPSPSLTPDFESISQSTSQLQSVPRYQLPPIPAIFPEPKSTRSLFTVLAAIATRHSNAIRSEAEEFIDRIVKEKVEEIKRAEAQLKRNVLALLSAYSDGIKKAEQEQNALQGGSTQNEPERKCVPSPPVSPSAPVFTGVPASVIRDFVPMRITPSSVTAMTIHSTSSRHSPRPSSASITNSLPRVSALSASLATSSFHHPKAQNATAGGVSSSPTNSRINMSDTDSLQSLQSASSATLTAPQQLTNVFHFRRTVEDINTAASFRYFQLEEEMKKRELEADKNKNKVLGNKSAATTSAGPSKAPVTPASSSKANGNASKTGRARESQVREKQQESEKTVEDQLLASPKSKGKRKVTFDVHVDDTSNPENTPANLDSEDMLFDFEEETNGRNTMPVVLPFVDSAYQQQGGSGRPRLHKRSSSGGSATGSLPPSFSALRPASLPAPSHIPLPVPSQTTPTTPSDAVATQNGTDIGNDFSNNVSSDSPTRTTDSNVESDPNAFNTSNDPVTTAQTLKRERHTQILNLLAASLPSHRAAWAGKNYETFVRGAYENHANEDEEAYDSGGDDDTETEQLQRELLLAGIPSSVPVTIHRPNSKPKAPPLSLASYQPDAVLADNMDSTRHPSSSAEDTYKKHLSSAALRRASYAERDVERGVDPGMFDYLLDVHQEEDEIDDDDDEDQMDRGRDSGYSEENRTGRKGRGDSEGPHPNGSHRVNGRDRAHKILESQAKSGVPDDEMWRSLI